MLGSLFCFLIILFYSTIQIQSFTHGILYKQMKLNHLFYQPSISIKNYIISYPINKHQHHHTNNFQLYSTPNTIISPFDATRQQADSIDNV